MARLAVVISDAIRGGLEGLIRAGNTAQKVARRARIGLMASEGRSDSAISRELGINRKTVALWRQRMAESRPAEPAPTEPVPAQPVPAEPAIEPGIQEFVVAVETPPRAIADAVAELGSAPQPRPQSAARTAAQPLLDRRPKSGPKRVLTPEMVERLVHTTLQEKPPGRTHWTTRSLAKHLGISKMAVQRVWKKQNLQPHRMETFKFSKDKLFVEKLTDVVGTYMHPPANSVVYCVDEKSQIQALDRTQPGLPWKKGKCGTRTHDYKRHGTTTLFAAYQIATGEVIGECRNRHSNQEFLCFLRRLDRVTAAGLDVHVILDNAGYHSHPNVKRWLQRHPRFHFHFVPTSSSWSNLVERWFGLLTIQCVRRGVFHSVKELQVSIQQYIEAHNTAPQPFHWSATVDGILRKIQRAAWKAGITLPWSLPLALAS